MNRYISKILNIDLSVIPTKQLEDILANTLDDLGLDDYLSVLNPIFGVSFAISKNLVNIPAIDLKKIMMIVFRILCEKVYLYIIF